MARSRQVRCTPEFKAEAIRLVQPSDTPIRRIARDLGISAKTLHLWLRAAGPQAHESLAARGGCEWERADTSGS